MTLFPTYLLQRGRIGPAELVQAVVEQQTARPRLGELALNRGKLTQHQLHRILEQRGRSNDRLGQIAVRLGALSEEDVNQLLDEQQSLEPDLTDVLLQRGALTPSTLNAERRSFSEQQIAPPSAEQARRASRSWACTIAGLAQLKPFSVAVREAMEIASRPDASPAALARVLERDPAITVAALRLANSAMFRRGVPCETLDEAAARLGIRNIQHIILGLSLLGVFSAKDRSAIMVRDHCAGVAALCRALANAVAPRKANEAFLAGLTHDIGKLLLIQSGEFSYSKLPHAIVDTPGKVREIELAELGFDHSILGHLALALWDLPESVVKAVGLHHETARAHEESSDVGAVAALVALCDRLDYHQRFSPQYTAAVAHDLAADPDARHLGLAPGHVEEVWVELVAARAELSGVLA